MAGLRRTAQSHTNHPACIWMQAGVVKFKHCAIDFDCRVCRFDKTLRRVAEENRRRSKRGKPPTTARQRILFWRDALMALPPQRRPCIHSMKQRIAFRSCTNDYVCGSCEFDQYFQDQFSVHAVLRPVAVQEVRGVKFPQGYYLHRGHSWVRLETDGEVRIGLDAFASQLFGTPDALDLPLMGKPLQRDLPVIGLNRQRWRAELLAPVSGVVTAANTRVVETPDLLNSDPYGEGWLLLAHAEDLRSDVRALLMGEEATAHLESDIEALHAVIDSQLGPLAADGGHLVADILSHLPRDCWDAVAQQFLRPPVS
ncbi:MAG: glycine cleavage system protein H [Desulfosarcinaceae bacterium]|nr:glycine cleavage system protein H [Desulfosarcinaceae bacterium]